MARIISGMFPLICWTNWLLGALIACICAPAAAHNPHDPVHSIALSPTFPMDQTVFIGQYPAINWGPQDILRSEDGGETWTELPAGMTNRSDFSSINVSPYFADDQIVFATTEEDGVFRSLNGGRSWQRTNGNLPTQRISASAIAKSARGTPVVFVTGTNGGLFRTDNLGESWTAVLPPTHTIALLALSPDFQDDSTILIVDSRMRLRSSQDGGQIWIDHGRILEAGNLYALAIAPQFTAFGEFFIGAEGGVYQSADFGQSFVLLRHGLPTEPVTTLAVSPNYREDNTLLCTSRSMAVFKSIDAGQTWQHYDAHVELTGQTGLNKEFRVLQFSPGFALDKTVFLAAYAGLFKSTDGAESWQELQTRSSLVTSLAISPRFAQDTTVAVSLYNGNGIYVSTDRGNSWVVTNQHVPTTRPGRSSIYDVMLIQQEREPLRLFAALKDHLIRSHDWQRGFTQVLLSSTEIGQGIYPTTIAIAPEYSRDHEVFLGTRQGVLHTWNGGVTWEQTLSGLGFITSLGLSPDYSADRTIFAALNAGQVYRSIDGGLTWAAVVDGLPADRGNVWLAISPQFPVDQMVLAGTTYGLYRTSDAGETWQGVEDETVGQETIAHVEFSPKFSQDSTIFVAVRGIGLFRSTDAGRSWEAVAPYLINRGIQFSKFRLSPNFATDDTIFGITRATIYRSRNGGQNWQDVLHVPVPMSITVGDRPPGVDHTILGTVNDLPVLQFQLDTGAETVHLQTVTLTFADLSGDLATVKRLQANLILDANRNGQVDVEESLVASQTASGVPDTLTLTLMPLDLPRNATTTLLITLDVNTGTTRVSAAGLFQTVQQTLLLLIRTSLLPSLLLLSLGLYLCWGVRWRHYLIGPGIGLLVLVLGGGLAVTSCSSGGSGGSGNSGGGEDSSPAPLNFTVTLPANGINGQGTISGQLSGPAVGINSPTITVIP